MDLFGIIGSPRLQTLPESRRVWGTVGNEALAQGEWPIGIEVAFLTWYVLDRLQEGLGLFDTPMRRQLRLYGPCLGAVVKSKLGVLQMRVHIIHGGGSWPCLDARLTQELHLPSPVTLTLSPINSLTNLLLSALELPSTVQESPLWGVLQLC